MADENQISTERPHRGVPKALINVGRVVEQIQIPYCGPIGNAIR